MSLVILQVIKTLKYIVITKCLRYFELRKRPLAFIIPSLWCLKYRLYPPLAALMAAYLVTFFINIYLFALTYIILSRFVYVSQDNILRSFTLFAGKSHYMTIASTNENDVSALVKKIDPKIKLDTKRMQSKSQQ